jgi:uncharacterized protein (DUF488 family)
MNDARGLTIWTVGHSSRPWEEFLALLQSEQIEVVIDVRRHAGSRKHPQYGPEQLPAALNAEGIDYVAIPELGGRRRPRADSPNTAWRNPSFRGYADHMSTEEYARGRTCMLQIAAERRAALLCSEAVWWRCHRSLIADDLKAAGAKVLHIMARGKVTEHPYTSAASLEDGTLRYRASGQA